MGLSNYQLVLLDNLIYLEEVVRATNGRITIEKIVNNLLYKDGDKSNGIGSGTIEQDWRNPYKPEAENCMTSKEEWIAVLKAIAADPVLCSLTVHKVEDHKSGELDGFRAMEFTGDALDDNPTVVRHGQYHRRARFRYVSHVTVVRCQRTAPNNRRLPNARLAIPSMTYNWGFRNGSFAIGYDAA